MLCCSYVVVCAVGLVVFVLFSAKRWFHKRRIVLPDNDSLVGKCHLVNYQTPIKNSPGLDDDGGGGDSRECDLLFSTAAMSLEDS